MNELKASREAVFAACEALVQENQKITVLSVLDRTGGSTTTVRKHMNDWKAGQVRAAPQQISDAARDRVLAAVAAVAAEASLGARADADRLRAEFEAARAETAAAEAAFCDVVDQRTAERDAALAESDDLRARLALCHVETERLTAQARRVADLEHALDQANGRAQALQTLSEFQREQLERLQAEKIDLAGNTGRAVERSEHTTPALI